MIHALRGLFMRGITRSGGINLHVFQWCRIVFTNDTFRISSKTALRLDHDYEILDSGNDEESVVICSKAQCQ